MELFNLYIKVMSKIIHIFDMDDTIFETPMFADLIQTNKGEVVDTSKVFEDYFLKVKNAFWEVLSKEVYFKRLGDFIVPFNSATNKPFSDGVLHYFHSSKDMNKLFLSQDGILALNSFPGFHKDQDTLGMNINEPIVKEYESADNKMIITGRGEEMRERIMSVLRYLDIDFPNYGLYLFYQSAKYKNIEQFKVQTILNSIKEHNWDTVHFYEDRQDWLKAAETAVTELFPSVNFVSHLVTNIKNKRSL